MPYKLKPGVMQDYRGRYFQYAEYPSGKTIIVPCSTDKKAPRHEPIPITEPAPRVKHHLRGEPTTGMDSKRPIIHRPKRLPALAVRRKNREWVEETTFPDCAEMHAFTDEHKALWDHHYMYIKEITT